MSKEQEMDHGYAIDAAYKNADMFATGSDQWHYWMNKAKEAEEKARDRK